MKQLGLNRTERLKEQRWISQLFEEGLLVRSGALAMKYVPADWGSAVSVKVAFSVPKRRFKRATDRNRIKRLMREAYRLNKAKFLENWPGNWAIMFIFQGSEIPTLNYLESRLLKLSPQESGSAHTKQA